MPGNLTLSRSVFIYKSKFIVKILNLNMKNIQEDTRLVEDITELNESKINIVNNNKEITLLFRNQSSKDTTINIDLTKIISVSNLSDELLSKLGKSKTESSIRLFFKGRPLKNEEKIKDLGKKIIKFENNIFINYSFFKF